MATLTSDFQKFSPFTPLEEEGDQQPGGDTLGTGPESVVFLSHHIRGAPASCASTPRAGPNGGGPLDYNPYYAPTPDYYSSLAKEHSLESQDSSTLSSPPSDGLAQTGTPGAGEAAAPDSLFQFSIGKILEDEGGPGAVGPGNQGNDCDLQTFYEGVVYPEGRDSDVGPTSPLQLHATNRSDAERSGGDQRQVKRSAKRGT